MNRWAGKGAVEAISTACGSGPRSIHVAIPALSISTINVQLADHNPSVRSVVRLAVRLAVSAVLSSGAGQESVCPAAAACPRSWLVVWGWQVMGRPKLPTLLLSLSTCTPFVRYPVVAAFQFPRI
jgi:hypothetical protein